MQKSFLLFFAFILLSPTLYADIKNLTEKEQCINSNINFTQANLLSKKIYFYVTKNQPEQLAKLASYPLSINFSEKKIKTITIKNEKEFISLYPTLKKYLQKMLSNTKPTDIFCNLQGGMIANGAFWFNENDGLRFFVINIQK